MYPSSIDDSSSGFFSLPWHSTYWFIIYLFLFITENLRLHWHVKASLNSRHTRNLLMDFWTFIRYLSWRTWRFKDEIRFHVVDEIRFHVVYWFKISFQFHFLTLPKSIKMIVESIKLLCLNVKFLYQPWIWESFGLQTIIKIDPTIIKILSSVTTRNRTTSKILKFKYRKRLMSLQYAVKTEFLCIQ